MISFEAPWDNDQDRRPVSDLGFMRRRLLGLAPAARGATRRESREVRYAPRSGAGVTSVGGNQARMNKQYSGQSWLPPRPE
jgi:hypothetical protein